MYDTKKSLESFLTRSNQNIIKHCDFKFFPITTQKPQEKRLTPVRIADNRLEANNGMFETQTDRAEVDKKLLKKETKNYIHQLKNRLAQGKRKLILAKDHVSLSRESPAAISSLSIPTR